MTERLTPQLRLPWPAVAASRLWVSGQRWSWLRCLEPLGWLVLIWFWDPKVCQTKPMCHQFLDINLLTCQDLVSKLVGSRAILFKWPNSLAIWRLKWWKIELTPPQKKLGEPSFPLEQLPSPVDLSCPSRSGDLTLAELLFACGADLFLGFVVFHSPFSQKSQPFNVFFGIISYDTI